MKKIKIFFLFISVSVIHFAQSQIDVRSLPKYSNSEMLTTNGTTPLGKSFVLASPDAGVGGLEIVHMGNAGISGNPLLPLSAGILRNAWAMAMYHNLNFNRTGYLYGQKNTSYPSSWVESGTEGITSHVIGPGRTPQNTQHEIFQSRWGLDSDLINIATGQYNQAKAPIVQIYDNRTYGSDVHSWTDGSISTGLQPMMWWLLPFQRPEMEVTRMETNISQVSGGVHFFKKSRGSYAAKTASLKGDIAGFLTWAHYGGSTGGYLQTARILARLEADATNTTAPQSIVLQTSPTDANGYKDDWRLWSDGYISHVGRYDMLGANPSFVAHGVYNTAAVDGTTNRPASNVAQCQWYVGAKVATTAATQTTAFTFDKFASYWPSGSIRIRATVNARQTGGSAGTTGNAGSWELVGQFKMSGGTITQTGSTVVRDAFKDDASWEATFSISGGNILVRVTGAANQNITWCVNEFFVTPVSN